MPSVTFRKEWYEFHWTITADDDSSLTTFFGHIVNAAPWRGIGAQEGRLSGSIKICRNLDGTRTVSRLVEIYSGGWYEQIGSGQLILSGANLGDFDSIIPAHAQQRNITAMMRSIEMEDQEACFG